MCQSTIFYILIGSRLTARLGFEIKNVCPEVPPTSVFRPESLNVFAFQWSLVALSVWIASSVDSAAY